jgi:hypothetical protein
LLPRNSAALVVTIVKIVAMVVIVAPDASAHRRDEYLQAARLGIDPGRVRIELDLTPGIAVAGGVLAEIDRDRSGAISDDEARAYAAAVSKGVTLEVDGTPIPVELIDTRFRSLDAVMNGEGAIRLELAAAMPRLSNGLHRLRYRNAHRSDIGVYLANALVPDSDRVSVRAQERDGDQRELTIEYTLNAGTRGDAPIGYLITFASTIAAAFAGLWSIIPTRARRK